MSKGTTYRRLVTGIGMFALMLGMIVGFTANASAADTAARKWVDSSGRTWCVTQVASTETTPAMTMVTPVGDACKGAADSKLTITKSKVVSDLPAGTFTVKPGHTALVVLRVTDNDALTINVSIVILTEGTYQFGPGMVALEGWFGYNSAAKASIDGCGEAQARAKEAAGDSSLGHTAWDLNYIVTFNGGAVPANCQTYISATGGDTPALEGTPASDSI